MATSKELRAQAEELIKQAEALELQEKNEALEAIRSLMAESGLTPEDLIGKGKPNKGTGKGTGKSTGRVAAQFQNPETGETWTGRGRAPRWLDGKDREEFRIKE